jgi:transcriptional regulator with XRE-family HTH domain
MKIKDVVKRTIAANIKRARVAANMTQAEAAEKLGVTAQAISNFERGINGIENSLLLQMCEIYHTSMSSIMGDEEENTPSEFVLTEGERELIELFRMVPADQQPVVLAMIKAALGK